MAMVPHRDQCQYFAEECILKSLQCKLVKYFHNSSVNDLHGISFGTYLQLDRKNLDLRVDNIAMHG